jgi:hypothetical protein
MNGFVLALIAAIAGGLALVLFGKPKGDGQQQADRVERLEPTPTNQPPEIAPVVEPATVPTATVAPTAPVTSTPTAPKTPAPTASAGQSPIADPWADESAAPEPEVTAAAIATTAAVATAATMATAKPTASDASAPITTPVTAPATTPVTAPVTTADRTTPSMPPFAAIQDPKRPSTPELQDLSQEILEMGMSKQLRFVPKLTQYANHSDAKIRSYVAYALGQIAMPHTVKAEIETIIPVLGKLSQDKDLEVRQMAIKALSSIQSPKVLPYLEKGLLSSAGSVQQMANTAIQKLKLQYDTKPSEFPPALQKKPQ